MSDEIELKLLLTPAQLNKLNRLPLLRAFATGRAQRKQLDSTYFDTPEFTLRDRKMALRVRRVGETRLQTLKMAPETASRFSGGTGVSHGGVQHFLEFETEIGGDLPDLSKIEAAELQDWFAEERLAERLEPVFTTAIERRAVPLRMADTEIELAMDVGEIRARSRTEPISEAELEIKWGQPNRLFELAMMLSQELPVRLGGPTKAARGYALYAGEAPRPVKARRPDLDSEMTVAQAFTAILRSTLAQMRGNEAAVFAATDAEGVHQLRVGVRRARAALSVFKPAIHESVYALLAEELRWLQRELGPARDLDVFLADTVAPLIHRLPSEPSLPALKATAAEARKKAYVRAHAALEDPRYAQLLLRLELFLAEGTWRKPGEGGQPGPAEAPIRDLAGALLDKRQRQLRRTYRQARDEDEAALHVVRIAAKKLRYACEFFRELYGEKQAKAFIATLTDLQDTLGAVNDAVVGHRLLDELEPALSKSGEDARLAVGIVMGWQAARIQDDLRRFATVWRAWRGTRPFWRAKDGGKGRGKGEG